MVIKIHTNGESRRVSLVYLKLCQFSFQLNKTILGGAILLLIALITGVIAGTINFFVNRQKRQKARQKKLVYDPDVE